MVSSLPAPRARAQIGYLRRLFRDPQPVLDELRAAHGGVCGLGWGPVRITIVGDPALLRELFAHSAESFRWDHKFNVLRVVVGDGSMIVSDGADHQRRRAPVQAAFARRRLNACIPMIIDQTDAGIDRLAASIGQTVAVVDLYPLGRSVILHIVVRALFGERMGERADEIGALFQRPQDYLEAPAVRQLPHPIPFTRRSKVRADRRALDAIIDAEVARRRDGAAGDRPDVLDALIEAGTLSEAEIRDQVVSLIGAGYDTTSASLAWALWRAALEPGMWARLRAEADDVLGSYTGPHGPPDATLYGKLGLASRVVRETLRLHPAGVIAPREAATDIRLGDYTIAKGTLILWSAHLAGRDPHAWPEPLRFNPDRFVDPSPEQNAVADSAWVPFGGGARSCVGFALAQMELTLIVARFAQRLDLTATSDAVPRAVGMVVNRPAGGVPMAVTLRAV
jgi:cytochrome P450